MKEFLMRAYLVDINQNGIKIKGTVYISPSKYGSYCGYAVFIPDNCEKDTTLIMHSCNTGGTPALHLEEANEIAKKSVCGLNSGTWLGTSLDMPVLIPLIPRVDYYYTQSLRRQVYQNDVSVLIEENKKRENPLKEDEIIAIRDQCKDIDVQVVSMIRNAQLFLETKGIKVDDKVIAEGYSAGSQFANYFTALHPEYVKACICGGNSGLGIIPLSEYKGTELKYPLGVSDFNFNFPEFQQIPQLYYIGTEDYNDPAMYKCAFERDENGELLLDKEGYRIPKKDKSGTIIPIRDRNGRLQPRNKENYSQEEIEIIHRLFGANPQIRFNNQEKIYKELGINSTFKRFPGTHKTVTQQHNGSYVYTNECIKDFIRQITSKENEKQR